MRLAGADCGGQLPGPAAFCCYHRAEAGTGRKALAQANLADDAGVFPHRL
jgi:hypothetical protein